MQGAATVTGDEAALAPVALIGVRGPVVMSSDAATQVAEAAPKTTDAGCDAQAWGGDWDDGGRWYQNKTDASDHAWRTAPGAAARAQTFNNRNC